MSIISNARRLAVVTTTGAALGLGTLAAITPAATADTGPATISPSVSCSSNPKQNGFIPRDPFGRLYTANFGFTQIQLWYSPTCRTAWAREVNGISGDGLWVYNRNTAAIKHATFPAETGAIGDANTESHACMESIPNALPKTCTAYF